ncbi:hypothetical protein GCM10011578_037860 [Streptomyces fuscichromogenes]|uniref:Uncharacterized protein n=1 Tax=Streptomyces fuscichromogenes TaxID=1324013 RepID=A0A917XDA9_9ACTN|nr:hypothetical protein GCM10011578_037860 [Streptomyces fuscichromogenes]
MATALGSLSGDAPRSVDGYADRAGEGAWVVLRVGVPGVGSRALPPRVGATLGLGLGSAGAGDVEGCRGAVGLTAGGASGSRGDAGAEGPVRCSERATQAATAQVNPVPAAVRTNRRRLAARRISS